MNISPTKYQKVIQHHHNPGCHLLVAAMGADSVILPGRELMPAQRAVFQVLLPSP